MANKHILLLPGDGIGPEVVAQTAKIIDWFSKNSETTLKTEFKLQLYQALTKQCI